MNLKTFTNLFQNNKSKSNTSRFTLIVWVINILFINLIIRSYIIYYLLRL